MLRGSVPMERKLWENTTIEEIIDEVTRISRKYGVKHLFLFGSYARGTATKYSDIDFVIQGITNKNDYLNEIDNIRTIKKIDIVDYDVCRNENLKKDVDSYARKIY